MLELNVLPIGNKEQQGINGTPSYQDPSVTFKFQVDNYKMDNAKRGSALIFNHKKFEMEKYNTLASNSDCNLEEVKRVLEKLKFEVQIFTDLPKKALLNTAQSFARRDHTNNDCLAVIIITHGSTSYKDELAQTVLWAYDRAYYLETLTDLFTDNKCPTLRGKPRLFFIQACREGLVLNEAQCTYDGPREKSPMLPVHPDFLYMHASPRGYTTPHRDPDSCTRFIKTLIKNLEDRYQTEDLLKILVAVNRHFAIESDMKVEQICKITSYLTKLIRFN